MRRPLLASIVVLIALASAGYGIYWSAQPCRALDRLFGMSGCTEVIRIADFSPLNERAMSHPDAQGLSSLFGHTGTAEGWRPSMARIDLTQGRELARHPVRALNGFGNIAFARDGERALLTCGPSLLCTEDGKAAAILSLKDGAVLTTHDDIERYPFHFPGDPAPEKEEWRRTLAANGSRMVAAADRNTLTLLTAQNETVKTLLEGNERNGIHLSGVSVSPSGKHIALFDHARYGRPAKLYVWDALTGDLLNERNLGESYRWRIAPVWTDGETRLTLFRREGRDTLIELYRWR